MYSADIAKILLNTESVKVSTNPPFTYTSGKQGPIYCDNRRLISFVEERQLILDAFKNLIDKMEVMPDVLGGTATAAIPWAAFLAQELHLPMIYIRPEAKDHGAGKQIEGVLRPSSKVLIIEDLINSGGSSIKSAEAVRQEGQSEVLAVMAIMDYGFAKAHQAFDKANLPLKTLTNFEQLMQVIRAAGTLSDEEILFAQDWNQNPDDWSK